MTETLLISSSELSARIDPLGAELQSLSDRSGREYMWSGDAAIWSGRAPLLFPIVGALRDGCYRLGDRTYPLPKHGFARTSEFAVAKQAESEAKFVLTSTPETRAAYPFEFTLELGFHLVATTLTISAVIVNHGPSEMPFSFGFHPAFAWPLPGNAPKDDHRIVFECDEPAPIRRIQAETGLLAARLEPTPVRSRVLRPNAALFSDDALVWDSLASRRLSFGGEGGSWIDLEFPDLPHLGVWQKPGARFLAIEPWHGYNDPEEFYGELRDKPGIVLLAPAASRRFELRLTVRPRMLDLQST